MSNGMKYLLGPESGDEGGVLADLLARALHLALGLVLQLLELVLRLVPLLVRHARLGEGVEAAMKSSANVTWNMMKNGGLNRILISVPSLVMVRDMKI